MAEGGLFDGRNEFGEALALVDVLDAELFHGLLVGGLEVEAVDDDFLRTIGRFDDAGGQLTAGNLI